MINDRPGVRMSVIESRRKQPNQQPQSRRTTPEPKRGNRTKVRKPFYLNFAQSATPAYIKTNKTVINDTLSNRYTIEFKIKNPDFFEQEHSTFTKYTVMCQGTNSTSAHLMELYVGFNIGVSNSSLYMSIAGNGFKLLSFSNDVLISALVNSTIRINKYDKHVSISVNDKLINTVEMQIVPRVTMSEDSRLYVGARPVESGVTDVFDGVLYDVKVSPEYTSTFNPLVMRIDDNANSIADYTSNYFVKVINAEHALWLDDTK